MSQTDFLFAKPSFMRGFGRVLDLGSTRNIYNESKTERKADLRALKSDWCVTGDDIRKATKVYGRKNSK